MSRNGHRSAARALDHIAELVSALNEVIENAEDAGARKPHGPIGENGRGRGFTNIDSTGTMALDPRRRQLRSAVKRAATLISRTADELEEASVVLSNGYFRLDPDEWVLVVQKRSAALADRE